MLHVWVQVFVRAQVRSVGGQEVKRDSGVVLLHPLSDLFGTMYLQVVQNQKYLASRILDEAFWKLNVRGLCRLDPARLTQLDEVVESFG